MARILRDDLLSRDVLKNVSAMFDRNCIHLIYIMPYKAVFLDLDDTIGDFHGVALASLRKSFVKYELGRYFSDFDDYMSVYQPHNLLLWDKYGRSEITKDFLQRDRFEYPFRAKGCELPELAKQIGDDFVVDTREEYTLLPNALQVVRELASRYPLTIVSNGFVEQQETKMRKNGLLPYFRHVVLSEQVGVQKPDAEIFRYALRLNGVEAAEAVMVGDSYGSDIVGAKNAGIDQIWLTPRAESGQTATYIIADITELLQIL